MLIVDDSSCALSALGSLIVTLPGAEVIAAASDGAEAVRLAQELQPDVVLMDVRMPGMDGLEATRRIKAAASAPRVIVQSMCAAYRTAAIWAGADAFLVKGDASQDLVDAIAAAAAAGRASRRSVVARRPASFAMLRWGGGCAPLKGCVFSHQFLPM